MKAFLKERKKGRVQSEAIGFPWHKILRDRCQGMCVALDPNLVLDLAPAWPVCVHDSGLLLSCVLFGSESQESKTGKAFTPLLPTFFTCIVPDTRPS